MLFNIYHENILGVRGVLVAVSENFVTKITEAYLRGQTEIRDNGEVFRFGTECFHIYQIPSEVQGTTKKIREFFNTYANQAYSGNYFEEVFSDHCEDVTQVFLQGREWGDLKEDLYNLYYDSKGKTKHLVIAVSKKQIEKFLIDWERGQDPIHIDGRSLDIGAQKNLRIFDIKLQYLKKTRGELKLDIRKSLRNLYRGDITIQLLEDFGNDVSSDFNIQPFGVSSNSLPKNNEGQYHWNIIHPVIAKYSKPRYEAHHFADAVEAAYKELNDVIKKEYLAVKQIELDGPKLMRTVFSSSHDNDPVFKIASHLMNIWDRRIK
jgi:hypothetical protein